jgi:hypothetical protein
LTAPALKTTKAQNAWPQPGAALHRSAWLRWLLQVSTSRLLRVTLPQLNLLPPGVENHEFLKTVFGLKYGVC